MSHKTWDTYFFPILIDTGPIKGNIYLRMILHETDKILIVPVIKRSLGDLKMIQVNSDDPNGSMLIE